MTGHRPITGNQALTARKLLGWTQRYAASRTSVSISEISRLERGTISEATSARLQAAYEAAGVEFTDEQPEVRMRKGHAG